MGYIIEFLGLILFLFVATFLLATMENLMTPLYAKLFKKTCKYKVCDKGELMYKYCKTWHCPKWQAYNDREFTKEWCGKLE
ncbi:MAG: hypothetical protein A2Y23_11830 [Clostridiales bacterium GWB2_37_7]|nr:MAG: hypothetical protein A2Y23_11830 [Clostridiales bacterium GWB2_37_7]